MALFFVFSFSVHATDSPVDVALSDAVDVAQKAYGGQAVKVDKVTLETGEAYRIRLVNNGHVKEVLVDATSGKLLPP